MGSFRQDKINEETSREITEILRTVKDPRIAQAFVSITGCEVTKDLSYAKVYYSVWVRTRELTKVWLPPRDISARNWRRALICV